MNGVARCAGAAVSSDFKVGPGEVVLGREAPAIRASDSKATFFKGLQSFTEPGVIDVQLPA